MENNAVQSPCKNCRSRHVACHAECNRYAAFRTELEAYNQKVREEKQKEAFGAPLTKKKPRRQW